MTRSSKDNVYFCDYTKNALEEMKKHSFNNSDIQEIFNHGFSESTTHKILDKNGLSGSAKTFVRKSTVTLPTIKSMASLGITIPWTKALF